MTASIAAPALHHIGYLFYCVDPRTHVFSSLDEVPQHTVQAVPFFLLFVLVEVIISFSLKRKHDIRAKDIITSLHMGICSEMIGKSSALAFYLWTYERRLMDIPYDSVTCYVVLVLGIDFAYYWMHRISHEFHFGWIGHSVHHSGEYYNLATALRQGMSVATYAPIFYAPLALLGLPPPMFLAHKALNLLYQFWIHTTFCGSLGPLEYVLNVRPPTLSLGPVIPIFHPPLANPAGTARSVCRLRLYPLHSKHL